MQRLTEIALERSVGRVFTRLELVCWLGGSPGRLDSLLKRALASGEVVRIHRGLYCLSRRHSSSEIDPLVLAQRIHGPSYISLESALSHHGWIPEAVYSITSVSLERAREFDTPLGLFSYTRVPQKTLYAGVRRAESGQGDGFLLASPIKALADYVYVHKCDWDSARPVVESLRIDENLLASVESSEFDPLLDNYSSRRVRRFLRGLRKDVNR